MSMDWRDARLAFEDAKRTLEAVDAIATDMAIMLSNDHRLRQVKSENVLRKLKAELRDFDMTTGHWKTRR